MKRGKYRMCGRKRRYSLRRAHKVAERINDNQESNVHAYHCPICGQYHIGHSEK